MLAVQGGLGIGNVGRRKQICFQKVGGSSIVVRKLIGRGRSKGLAYSHTSRCLLLDELHQDACILFAVHSNYILQDLNDCSYQHIVFLSFGPCISYGVVVLKVAPQD
jgi:hypothetical protein